MAKYTRYVPRIVFPKEPLVVVPDPLDMSDEIFLKHLEHRHAKEVKFEKTPVARHAVKIWLPAYRAFHDRLHDLEVPGQYDHEHE